MREETLKIKAENFVENEEYKHQDIWDLDYISSSDQSDNDKDSEEEEEASESDEKSDDEKVEEKKDDSDELVSEIEF